MKELNSGARAIVPQQTEESELWRRVASTDADERMPPEGPPLVFHSIQTVRRARGRA